MWLIFKATLLQLVLCIPSLKCTYSSSLAAFYFIVFYCDLHNVIVLINQYTIRVCIIDLGILGTVTFECQTYEPLKQEILQNTQVII